MTKLSAALRYGMQIAFLWSQPAPTVRHARNLERIRNRKADALAIRGDFRRITRYVETEAGLAKAKAERETTRV